MPELLLEIGTDEMPARMLSAIAGDLSLRAIEDLAEDGPAEGGIRVLYTPRRLALIASGLSAKGFTGEELEGVISRILDPGITGESGDLSPHMFIRYLVCLYGDQVVPLRVRNVIAAGATRGHWRTFGGEEIALPSTTDYEQALAGRGVIVDQERRKEMVKEGIGEAAREVGSSAKIDDEQVAAIVYGTEYPHPVSCLVNIPSDLPAVFVEAALRDENFVPLPTGQEGIIRFVGFADGAVDREIVRAGYQRAAQSALHRCGLLFSRDRREHLVDYVRTLRGISDESGLGSLWEKTERLRTLSGGIAQMIHASPEAVDRAAFLCQADRATWIVREFPPLHGTAGSTYAALDGEESIVCSALKEGPGIPGTPEGLALAIAQRYDDLCTSLLTRSDWRVPEVVGIADDLIGLMIGGEVDLDLARLLRPVSEQYRILAPTMRMEDLEGVLSTLLEERLLHYLETGEQIRSAIVSIIPRGVRANPYRSSSCARALQEAAGRAEFAVLRNSFAGLRGHFHPGSTRAFDPALFEGESEKALWREYLKAEGRLEGFLAELDYKRAIDQLVLLGSSIDRYTEDVDPHAGSENVRKNRQGLIACVVDLYAHVGDFDALLGTDDHGPGEEKR